MASDEHDILIEPDGTVRFVYSDELAEAFAGEALHTVRASHVEPHPAGGWIADMGPSGGLIVGANGMVCAHELHCHVLTSTASEAPRSEPFRGFATRQEALAAERAWLREHRGL